jgi:tight adherence protein B
MTAAIVGVLMALAARLVLGPRPRGAGALGLGRADGRAVGGAARPVGRGAVALGRQGSEPAVAVAQVAALLRSGAEPAAAWATVTGARCDAAGVPRAGDLMVLGGGARARQVAGVVAAARLAVEIGAPLARVLDDVGEAMVASDEARAERDGALAGPRATARVLLWMPVAGLGLGYALGADPVRVLVGGGLGTTALVLGALLLEAGRRWTNALVDAARRSGEPA